MSQLPADTKRDYDRHNLDLARQVLDDANNPEVAHLLDWARRVIARLDAKTGTR